MEWTRALQWYEKALLETGPGQVPILRNIDVAREALEAGAPAAPAPGGEEVSHPRVD